jgi:hypothetical protein
VNRPCWILVLLALTAGCGSSGQNAASSGSNQSAARLPGYLALSSNGASFIQWQRQGNMVTGKLSESYYDPSKPTELQASAHSFTGSISGSNVSLSLDTGDTWSGSLNGSALTLSYTASDGSVQTLDFRPASAADYNAAVQQVKANVNGAVQTQAQQQAIQQSQHQVDSDASGLADDFSSLRQATSTVNGDGFATDLGQMRSDVQRTHNDLQTTLSDGDPTQLCADSSQTDADESDVEADQSQIQANTDSIHGDLSSLDGDVSALQSAEQTYQADQAAVPNYQPSTAPPTSGQVKRAISAADTAAAKARARIHSANATANQLVAQAKGYASLGDAACNKAGG